MADDDEVIVNLQGDTSTTQVTKVDGGSQTVSFNEGDDDPIGDLKKQFSAISGALSSTQAEVQQTRQQLDDANQRIQRAESHVTVNQIDTIRSGITTAENEAANAERAYAAAFEAGDGPAMARAQRYMARQETVIQRLREAEEDLSEQAKRGGTQQQQTRQQPSQTRQQPTDPVEATIVNGRLSARSAAWLRAHPECITDKKTNARMMAAHNLALAEDVEVDSDEYFKRIEDGIKVAKKAEPGKSPTTTTGTRPSSAAASGAGQGGGLNGGTISVPLTKREAASATDGTLVWNYDDPTSQKRFSKGDPIGLAEMARRKHEGQKAGLYDKNNFEA